MPNNDDKTKELRELTIHAKFTATVNICRIDDLKATNVLIKVLEDQNAVFHFLKINPVIHAGDSHKIRHLRDHDVIHCKTPDFTQSDLHLLILHCAGLPHHIEGYNCNPEKAIVTKIQHLIHERTKELLRKCIFYPPVDQPGKIELPYDDQVGQIATVARADITPIDTLTVYIDSIKPVRTFFKI